MHIHNALKSSDNKRETVLLFHAKHANSIVIRSYIYGFRSGKTHHNAVFFCTENISRKKVIRKEEKKMSRVQTVCLVLAVVFACTESYKTGAPVGACELMTPYHLDKKNSSIVTEAQNVENPYDLLVSTNTVVSLPYAGNNSSPTNSAPYVKGKRHLNIYICSDAFYS